MTRTATQNAHALPSNVDERWAKSRNASLTTQKISRSCWRLFACFDPPSFGIYHLSFAPDSQFARTRRPAAEAGSAKRIDFPAILGQTGTSNSCSSCPGFHVGKL